ncbi:MAG: MMPL family transporter [Bacteroidales bacterium]|nr:MMPL family transporter [Bacteroidales bacterium]
MSRFTIFIYLYFKKHKALFYGILISTTLFFAYFGLKINFEEDISKLLPSVEKGGTEKLVFSNLKVKDKIFILFNPVSDTIDTDELVDICDEFVQALLDKDTINDAIYNVLYQIDESLFQNGITFLYENVPVFLEASQYRQLDSLLQKEQVEKQMEENYATLISTAGMAFRDVITQDPIALRNIFMSGLGGIGSGLGGNFTFYNGHIFTSDTTVAIAFLSPNFKSFDSKKGTRLSEMIEQEIASFQQQYPGVEILYHGAPVQSVYNSKRIKKDLLLTISVSLALIFVLLIICFRNRSTLVYLITPVIYGVLFALAVMYFIKGSMSLMAMGIGAIVMGVAFSYCLHVITHYKYVSDPKRVLKDQTIPVILGSLTTIGAFMGLVLTKSELLQDFGLFASLGLVGTTVFCLLFLPQFFNPRNNKKSEKAFAILEKINSFPFEKQKWLIALILIVSAVCFAVSDKVKFDSDLQNIGYHDKRVVRSQKLLSSKANEGQATVYFAAASGDFDSALIYGEKLCSRLDEALKQNQIKGYSAAFTLFVPMNEQQERIDRWNEFWTDERKEDIRKNITEAGKKYKFAPTTFTPFFDMLDTEYEPVSLYEADVIPEEILDNIIEYTDDQYLVFVPVQMDRKYLTEVGDNIVKDDPDLVVIDPMYYTSDMVKMIHDDFNTTLTISSLFVLLVLLLSFRSIVLSILAFLPMGLSWYIVLGSMAIFGMEFNLINIVISAFVFGIGVDYSIFIMDGLLAGYRTRSPLLMYHKTAIFFSAVILIVVVSSLLFAVHPAISSIGVATLIGMGATILIAYSLQPFLFSLLITGRTEKGKAPIGIANLFSLKNPQPQRILKDNYLYKGYDLEHSLSKDLRKTNNYALISNLLEGEKNVLDYGCGYGFCSYWVALTDKQINITGFDTDWEAIALADNCFSKTDRMTFSTDYSVLNLSYDMVIINKTRIITHEKTMIDLFSKAKKVVLRKDQQDKYIRVLTDLGFGKSQEDAVFVCYSQENNNNGK